MFDHLSCRDFYAMLVEDFDNFMAEPHSIRRAWHCAITAYHLHEWVWGDWLKGNDEARRLFNVKKREDFLGWIDAHCVWFSFIQQLATGAKHFVRQPGSQPILIAGYGEGAYGVGPYGKGYLVIDVGEEPDDGALPDDEADDLPGYQRWQTAASFLEVVVRFWRDFFRAYLPHPDLPASRHHSM